MNPTAIALVLSSTFMHASWNLLARRRRSEGLFFERMNLITLLLGFIPAVWSELLVRSIPPKAWFYLMLSGISCGFYYLSLATAYSWGDFTVVYPVARALPVLMLGLIDALRGRFPSPLGWLGMVLVSIGCMLSPLTSLREITPSRYLNRSSLWVFLTALGTVGYSTFDKLSSEIVLQGPATAARYGYFFASISGICYIAMRRAAGRRLMGGGKEERDDPGWKAPLLGSLFNFGAYWLVLWAYQLTGRASYVVAFRQFSIAIGVAAAFLIYKERGVLIRTAAALIITAGLIAIGLGG